MTVAVAIGLSFALMTALLPPRTGPATKNAAMAVLSTSVPISTRAANTPTPSTTLGRTTPHLQVTTGHRLRASPAFVSVASIETRTMTLMKL
jgi:hypothetical protein